mmetsp:Transcript_24369/g.42662  ORF Transcript_24369/g.42662 Transcript_24369/m.42662 type:complete len:173 (-) Transcript_24369:107-625(-)
MPSVELEQAIMKLEAAAPARQARSTRARPKVLENFTSRGTQNICATENADVAHPTSTGFAPSFVMYKGSDEMATPSLSICVKTFKQACGTAGGSGSFLEVPAAAEAENLCCERLTRLGEESTSDLHACTLLSLAASDALLPPATNWAGISAAVAGRISRRSNTNLLKGFDPG